MEFPMKRLVLLCALVTLSAFVAVVFVDWSAASAGSSLAGLSDVFSSAHGMVRDTNGDGLADLVAARILVPVKPTSEDILSATNMAARLGYETLSMTLPLVLREDNALRPEEIALPILVGRENSVIKRLAADGFLDLKSLKPGQGLIAHVPSPLGGPDGLAVVGGDDAGTLAAANELAARLPRVWTMTGITLQGIENQAIQYLKSKGIAAAVATVESMIVDSDRRGVARINVRIQVGSADGARARSLLENLDLAHHRGLEPKTLDFANVAVIDCEVVAGGKSSGHEQVSRSGLNPRTLTPPIDPDELAPDTPPGVQAPSAPAKNFDLASTYSIDGWFGDVYPDLIPDRSETSLILGDASESFGAALIAARLGLETTGITLPISKLDRSVKEPNREASPILVGRGNTLVQQLVKIGKTRFDDLHAGEGMIHLVPKAFGNATATVVAGADAAGTEGACDYLARRMPSLWDTARGAPALSDVVTDVTRFFQARSGAGQASQALGELESIAADLKDKKLESFEAKLFLEKADPALDAYLAGRLKSALPQIPVTVQSQAVTDPVTVFEDKIDIPWEVDEFWTKFNSEVLPKVKTGARVVLEARLSESPEVRQDVAAKVRAELKKAGAESAQVAILSAYKQGFLWLTEQVIPELKGKGARSIQIKVATYHPDLSKNYKFYTMPSRWLQELYPVDEIFQRDLGIPTDACHLELVDNPKDVYTLEALDVAGRVVYRNAFSPKFVEREYLDKFPGWSRVQVTTGWITALVDGAAAIDARIPTDPERFWDYYQTKVLSRIYDYVMKTTDNKPMPDKQPFHRDLDIEVWMSEPDFRIGIDEEQISSLESLHEDIYFVTLDLFDALGRTTVKRRLSSPGMIYPIIHPNRPGQPGQARILFAGNSAAKPKIEVSYKEKGVEKPGRITRDLAKIDATAPVVERVVVRPSQVREIELQTEAKDDHEAARAADALDNLTRLHEAGLYRSAISYEHVDGVSIGINLKDARTSRLVKNTGQAEASKVLTAHEKPQSPLVTWDHIISPAESEEIIHRLSFYPEVRAYKAGVSYRGRGISVMEITLPSSGENVSLAKMTAYKPTIFITGRQHANEVSSTSHILRLAELLATDPSYKEFLKKVNVILQPTENPDGAQMAYDLQQLTPNYMLHAGRYTALGTDVASQVSQADPLLPEALVRGRLWREWLPDIYLNCHGYPSHEWVQQFSGYVPPGFRSYLFSRGWYTSISGVRDPRYADYALVTEAIREAVVREVNTDPAVHAMNLRHQDRYRRWAFGFSPYVFNQEVYKDTSVNYSDPETGEPNGSRRLTMGGGSARQNMNAWPQVTYFNGMTEAPDETAQGDWLNLVSRPGLGYLMASIKYLQEGKYEVQRIGEEGQRDSVSLTTFRARPVLPAKSPVTPSPAVKK
jgi:hypothetical protein